MHEDYDTTSGDRSENSKPNPNEDLVKLYSDEDAESSQQITSLLDEIVQLVVSSVEAASNEPNQNLINLVEVATENQSLATCQDAEVINQVMQNRLETHVETRSIHEPCDQLAEPSCSKVIPIQPEQPNPSSLHQQLLQPRRLQQQQQEQQAQTKTDDTDVAMYKAIAIKVKKELKKTKLELQKLIVSSSKEIQDLKDTIKRLEEASSLNNDKLSSAETDLHNLKFQLELSESQLKTVRSEFEIYKEKACDLLKQNNSATSNLTNVKCFDDEIYKQLKKLNEQQSKRISTLESQYNEMVSLNELLKRKYSKSNETNQSIEQKDKRISELEGRIASLETENDHMKQTIVQFRRRLRNPNDKFEDIDYMGNGSQSPKQAASVRSNKASSIQEHLYRRDNNCQLKAVASVQSDLGLWHPSLEDPTSNLSTCSLQTKPPNLNNHQNLEPAIDDIDDTTSCASESSDYKQTNGNIHNSNASQTSATENQNQLDVLTSAYLDARNTNSLLSEQVSALKDEIRRMQRTAERVELAENLEYLKNVLFKFLSLDSSQVEQRQRLVPVLTAILKLSPNETAKLDSIAIGDNKFWLPSSFFKL